MFARVTHVKVQPDKVEEATELFRNAVVPVAKEQAGFYGMRLLIDNTTGKAMSISLWESEEAMKAGEASGYLQEQYARFGKLFVAAPITEPTK